MKFKVSTSGCWDDPRVEHSMAIINEYPCLKDFAFVRVEESWPVRTRIKDEKGESIIQTNYEPRYQNYITIDTIEQLVSLIEAVDAPLVVTEDEIEIYDGYRE